MSTSSPATAIQPVTLEVTRIHQAPNNSPQWHFFPWLEKQNLPNGWRGVIRTTGGNKLYGTLMFSNGLFPDRREGSFGAALRDEHIPAGVLGTATCLGNPGDSVGLQGLRGHTIGCWVLVHVDHGASEIMPAMLQQMHEVGQQHVVSTGTPGNIYVFCTRREQQEPALRADGFRLWRERSTYLGQDGLLFGRHYAP